ncbi:hypothetical protein V3C99_017549 [Haemonchus contortus]
MKPSLLLVQLFCCACSVWSKLECDPTSSTKKPDPNNPESYLYCNLEGTFSRRKCLQGKIFNAETGACESALKSDMVNDDPFSQPFYQAPDDLCGSGIPLTILSAPVVCNPSISSCPDGYVCRMYERTGTSYCCQGSSPPVDRASCSQGHVAYFESNGKPRSCVLSSPTSCPAGFKCSLVSGTDTRCCAKDLGCPYNSAALLNPNTGSMVECSPSKQSSCQDGYSCVLSNTLQRHICCSSTSDHTDTCPNGETPLSTPSTCTPAQPCPTGYSCREGRCCPSANVCPAGLPIGGGPTPCSENNPCKDGYECVTAGGSQYCCPSRENTCSLPRHAGVTCASSRPAITRYYFDITTGSCRSFQFSQCGGNANNFNSLEECEGFCLDTQCQHGQAYRVGAVNAVCALTATNTCPQSYSCMSPVFGPSAVCCPVPELTCNEMVSAGTPCFGRSVTIQRFYFNPATRKCQSFQYYGCNGNGNNFHSMQSCENHCLNSAESVCGGAAVLMDPNQQPQRCSAAVPCPAGYECNSAHYCCPLSATSCTASMSRGNVCSGSPLRTMWYYDQEQRKCNQFAYNGCGGTANRFTSRKACMSSCVSSTLSGSCPRGMAPFIEEGDTVAKACTLNVMSTCPPSASCVRSTTNQPICCQTFTSCPDNRTPYVIPGSTSVVACNVDADECPTGNACVESSSVPGFHMCCSVEGTVSRRPTSGHVRKQPNTLAALIKSISPCPGQLTSNGQTCTVNALGGCPRNYLCFRDAGYEHGSCCRTGPPKCSMKQYVPIFVTGTQVQICQTDLGGCPRDSRCMTSSIPKVSICCQPYGPRAVISPGGTNAMARPLANPKCKNGDRPLVTNGNLVECSFDQNTCPAGYKCEFSSTGQAVCCGDQESIRCPTGLTAFEYGGRPLACPVGSTKCPNGYACVASMNPQYHLCCTTSNFMAQPQLPSPQCLRGSAYVDPALNQRQFCSPLRDSCPIGYQCMESDYPGQYICCAQGDLSEQFKGFCPPNQIPYVAREGFPTTCHMQLNPCPTTAPYVCIYSAMKQDSYCCAPIDTTAPSLPDPSLAAAPMRRIAGEYPDIPTAPPSSPYAGMSQTFPGGPIAPGMGPVAIPDPIPGVRPEKILPPSLASNINQNVNGNNLPPTLIATNLDLSASGNNFNYNNNNGYGYPTQNMNGYAINQIPIGVPLGGVPPNMASEVVDRVLSQMSQMSGQNFNAGGNPYMVNNGNLNQPGAGHTFSSHWSNPEQQTFTGCPLGSRALVRSDRSIVTCHDQTCPNGFWCVFAERENRFQCCSSSTILSNLKRPESSSPSSPSSYMVTAASSTDVPTSPPLVVECPPGFFLVDGKCLKVLFAGQKGCLSDEQCSAREANATCDSGYCVCPAAKPLVHVGKCVAACPEGFVNIAGRCYDPTTVIFMDSVDERTNGTIGGYCLETLVEEKRCLVENSYCSEKTVTCQCKIGYTLNMDFNNKEDKGSCRQDESSKFIKSPKPERMPAIDDELYFVDIGSNASDAGESPSNSTLEDDIDEKKYLFQADELETLLA